MATDLARACGTGQVSRSQWCLVSFVCSRDSQKIHEITPSAPQSGFVWFRESFDGWNTGTFLLEYRGLLSWIKAVIVFRFLAHPQRARQAGHARAPRRRYVIAWCCILSSRRRWWLFPLRCAGYGCVDVHFFIEKNGPQLSRIRSGRHGRLKMLALMLAGD